MAAKPITKAVQDLPPPGGYPPVRVNSISGVPTELIAGCFRLTNNISLFLLSPALFVNSHSLGRIWLAS